MIPGDSYMETKNNISVEEILKGNLKALCKVIGNKNVM